MLEIFETRSDNDNPISLVFSKHYRWFLLFQIIAETLNPFMAKLFNDALSTYHWYMFTPIRAKENHEKIKPASEAKCDGNQKFFRDLFYEEGDSIKQGCDALLHLINVMLGSQYCICSTRLLPVPL